MDELQSGNNILSLDNNLTADLQALLVAYCAFQFLIISVEKLKEGKE